MREIGHFIGGKAVKGKSGRFGDVFDPNTGEVQAKVALATKRRGRRGHCQCREGASRLGRDQPAAPRPRAVQIPRADREGDGFACQAPLLRARQDVSRRQGRHPARRGSGRVRLRHSASAEGRIYRRRRPRHRSLFDAAAARRRRRHHAVQFPGHDPDVEIRAGHRLRQCIHPQALGARSGRADAARRIAGRSRIAGRRAQCRQRRQGIRRHAAERSIA